MARSWTDTAIPVTAVLGGLAAATGVSVWAGPRADPAPEYRAHTTMAAVTTPAMLTLERRHGDDRCVRAVAVAGDAPAVVTPGDFLLGERDYGTGDERLRLRGGHAGALEVCFDTDAADAGGEIVYEGTLFDLPVVFDAGDVTPDAPPPPSPPPISAAN